MQLTWNNQPALGSLAGAISSTSVGTFASVDVTSFVRGNGAYSFAINAPDGAYVDSIFKSRESKYSPRLVLRYDAAPTTVPLNGRQVGVIGDSLTYQSGRGIQNLTTALVNTGWDAANIKIDASVGRPIAGDQSTAPGSVTTIKNWKAAGFDPYTYVIALGTNNKNATTAVQSTEINKVLTAIGPGHRIIWIGLGFRNATDARVLSFNANVNRIAAERSDLSVWTFNDYIHGFPQDGLWLSTDAEGVHMTFPGYDLRNAYYVQAVGPPPSV
jgi:hypothetical protein